MECCGIRKLCCFQKFLIFSFGLRGEWRRYLYYKFLYDQDKALFLESFCFGEMCDIRKDLNFSSVVFAWRHESHVVVLNQEMAALAAQTRSQGSFPSLSGKKSRDWKQPCWYLYKEKICSFTWRHLTKNVTCCLPRLMLFCWSSPIRVGRSKWPRVLWA